MIALLIFGGTVGKSAQFPLHVWLPDAAKGPIPALALIHTATTVSAGAFLMVRAFPLFAAAEASLQIPGLQITVVAFTGALTAILFSAIAIVQNDIRRVLAFSTISQLGFVVAALGIGDYAAGAFHLITHAFSKALLCLGSGSVIHGMEHGHAAHVAMEEVTANPREEFDPNDSAKMGGLARRQPVTYWTFVAGTLPLSGFPLLTVGFWSQERVLNAAYEIYHPLVFWMLAVAAILTAFYAARLLCLTFLGQPRSEAAANAQESERNMTIPLVVLAVLAACPGWGGALLDWFYRFAGNGQAAGAASFAWQPLAISAGFALGGLLAGYLAYGRRSLRAGQMDPVEAVMCWMWLGWLYDAMRDRSYLDELYQWIFVQGSILIADVSAWLDSTIVDGAVKGAWWVGQNLSRTSARIEAAMTELVNLAGSAGRATSRASAWLEANVVDASVSLAGRAGMKLSEISGLLDLQVVDRLVSLAGPCTRAISDLSDRFDRKVVDGAVNGVASVVKAGGWAIQRRAQTGSIQYYLLLAAVGVLVLVGCFVFLFLPDYLLEPISLGLLALVVILVIYFMIQFRNKESGTR